MEPTDPRSRGLGALIADALEPELPRPELLVRYAEDPGLLDAEQRSLVEWHLQRSPMYAAQLRLLQRTDFDALLEATAPRRSIVQPSLWSSCWQRMTEGVWPRWILVAAPAASLLLLWGARDWVEPTARSSSSSGLPQQATSIADAPPSMTLAPPAAGDDREPRPLADARSEAGSEETSERGPIVRLDSASPVEPDRAPAPPPIKPAPVLRAASEAPTPSTPSMADSPPPLDESMLVAMQLPRYRPPADAAPRPRRSDVLRGAGAANLELRALAPEHVARTRRPSPSLFWSLAGSLPEGAEVEFSITTSEAIDPLVRRSLPQPTSEGIQRIDLDPVREVLPVGVECRWSVVVRAGGSEGAREHLASGWLMRVAESGLLRDELERASAVDVAAVLAAAGLWYDALAESVDLADRFPTRDRTRDALADLLRQIGL